MKPSNSELPTNEPRPEEFPLGSLESRAAARALLKRRDDDLREIAVWIVLIGHGEGDCLGKWCTGTCVLLEHEWAVSQDGDPKYVATRTKVRREA